jgi:cell filamentation protein
MYDAIDDPYTYENSTVLVNKLDLRDQAELDAFEAEISSARAEEPLPEGVLDFAHYKAVHYHLFQDVYNWAGRVRTVRISKGGNPFCFPETSRIKLQGYSTICARPTFYGISMRKLSVQRRRTS